MSKNILGLDIRRNAVSAVVISRSIKGSRIENGEYIPLSDQNDFDGELVKALEGLTVKIDFSETVSIVSFPPDLLSYRCLSLPFDDARKVRQVIHYEIEPAMPHPMESLVLDFRSISNTNHHRRSCVVAAAAEKDELKRFLEILSRFGLDPETVTVGGYPWAAGLADMTENPENVLFIEAVNGRCTIFVGMNRHIGYIRSFKTKREFDATQLAGEIRKTLISMEEIYNLEYTPHDILITGSALMSEGLENELSQCLDIPVRRSNMIGVMEETVKKSPTVNWIPALFDGAYALTLAETKGRDVFNFRKGTLAAKKPWQEHKAGIIRSGILLLLVFAVFCIQFVLQSYSLEKQSNELNGQIISVFKSSFPETTRIVDPVHQMRVALDEKKKSVFVGLEPGGRLRVIDILNQISKQIPDSIKVEFTRMVVGPENIQISGETETFKAVDDIKGRLEKIETFKTVDISSTSTDKKKNLVRFKLKIDI